MRIFDRPVARSLFWLVIGLPLAAILCDSDPCQARSAQNKISPVTKKLFVRKIDFNFQDGGAEKVARAAMKTKCGDEFRRDRIADDLKRIDTALTTYSSKLKKLFPGDWVKNLSAEPTEYGENGVRITISTSPSMKVSSTYRLERRDIAPLTQRQIWGNFLGPVVRPNEYYSRSRYHYISSPAKPRSLAVNSASLHKSCRIEGTSTNQQRELQDFLDGKSECFAGYDAF